MKATTGGATYDMTEEEARKIVERKTVDSIPQPPAQPTTQVPTRT